MDFFDLILAGDFEKIKSFVATGGVNLNYIDSTGDSYLQNVIGKNTNYDILEFLINNGANINLVDSQYGSALHKAVFIVDYLLIEYLLNRGANINVVDNDGETPIYWAIRCGNEEMVEFLLSHNADYMHMLYGISVKERILREFPKFKSIWFI